MFLGNADRLTRSHIHVNEIFFGNTNTGTPQVFYPTSLPLLAMSDDSELSDEVPIWYYMSLTEKNEELSRMEAALKRFDERHIVTHGVELDTAISLSAIRQLAVQIVSYLWLFLHYCNLTVPQCALGFNVVWVASSLVTFVLVRHLLRSEKAILDRHNNTNGSARDYCDESRRLETMCNNALLRNDCFFTEHRMSISSSTTKHLY